MARINKSFIELKELNDYSNIKNIVQSKKSYSDRINELKEYATPYYFNLILKNFKNIYADV